METIEDEQLAAELAATKALHFAGMTAINLDVDQVSRVMAVLDAGADSGLIYEGGTLYVPAELAAAVSAIDPDDEGPYLARIKIDLKRAIDDAAEAERLRYITGGSGQAMTYARKVEEARAASADPAPSAANYPLLAASIGIDGPDVAAIAAVVLLMDAAWAQIGAAIEAARLGAKAAIDLAQTTAAARAVVPAWPQP